MAAPRITGAQQVMSRYGAGVYRFPNRRGLLVAEHRDIATGLIDGWAAVAITFWGDGPEDFTIPVWDMREALTDSELAAFASEIGGK